jgi:hypothetical protein
LPSYFGFRHAILIGAGSLVMCLVSRPLGAYPKYVEEARSFGARDCTFCHSRPRGSTGWSKRGQHLIREKTRRHADHIDVQWLTYYKPPAYIGRTKRPRSKIAAPTPTPATTESMAESATAKGAPTPVESAPASATTEAKVGIDAANDKQTQSESASEPQAKANQ